MFNQVKKMSLGVVLGAGIMVSGCATSMAGPATYNQNATVIGATPKYSTTVTKVPFQACTIVDVPIYQQSTHNNNSAGNTLMGAIIGGAIGNQIGNSKGNGAVGAVIGGLVGNSHGKSTTNTIVGYRQQNQCTTSYTNETVEKFIGTYVTVEYNGMKMSYTTQRQVNVGDTVQIRVSLNN